MENNLGYDLSIPLLLYVSSILPSRRPRIHPSLLAAIAAVVVLIASYILGMATLQSRDNSLVEPADLFIPRAIDVLVVIWCFWVGSSIGSFLNVVAYRMPRGESINGRSHCPRCHAQLKARDNFPVFGWLALGGRCRTCRLPISARYPIVEGLVGLTITVVAVAELYRLNLPRQNVHWHGGPFWAPIVDGPVLLMLLYHVVGLAVCWAFGLICLDNQRLPKRLVLFGMAAAGLPMLAYPTLMVVPWQMDVGERWRPDGLYIDAIIRIVTALVAATVLGRYLGRALCPSADPKTDPLSESTARLIDLIMILAVPILLVGWQASPAVAWVAAVLVFMFRPLLPAGCDSLGRFAIAMPFALTFQLLFWRKLYALPDIGVGNASSGESAASLWPSDGSSPWVLLFWLAMVGLAPLWLRQQESGGVGRAADRIEESMTEKPNTDEPAADKPNADEPIGGE